MKRTVVDTSVWRAFFSGRGSASRLGDLLEESGVVLVHPLVIGELVLGGLSPAEERLLQRLPQAEPSGHPSVLVAIRRYKLAKRKAQLWSLDRSLSSVADELGVGFGPTYVAS